MEEITKRSGLQVLNRDVIKYIAMLTMLNRDSLPNLPVVEEDGTLVGLITKSSLVSTLSQQFIDMEEAAANAEAAEVEGGAK